jgi:hypothetical protein
MFGLVTPIKEGTPTWCRVVLIKLNKGGTVGLSPLAPGLQSAPGLRSADARSTIKVRRTDHVGPCTGSVVQKNPVQARERP